MPTRTLKTRGLLAAIAESNRSLYIRIPGPRQQSWVERGWYSPGDLGTQMRSYFAVVCNDTRDVLSSRDRSMFVLSWRVFLVAASVFWLLSDLLLICLATQTPAG